MSKKEKQGSKNLQSRLPGNVHLEEHNILDFEAEELKEADQEMTNICIAVGFEAIKLFDLIRKSSHDQDEARSKFNKQVKRILKRIGHKDAKVKPPVDYINKKISLIVPGAPLKPDFDKVKKELEKPVEDPKAEEKENG